VVYESDRIRDNDFPNHVRIRQSASVDENAEPLSRFLSVPPETGRALAETPHLFVD
jgi:hypothetical protein